MKPTLQLKLTQQLNLTPQLQQSIRLLQLSSIELNQSTERGDQNTDTGTRLYHRIQNQGHVPRSEESRTAPRTRVSARALSVTLKIQSRISRHAHSSVYRHPAKKVCRHHQSRPGARARPATTVTHTHTRTGRRRPPPGGSRRRRAAAAARSQPRPPAARGRRRSRPPRARAHTSARALRRPPSVNARAPFRRDTRAHEKSNFVRDRMHFCKYALCCADIITAKSTVLWISSSTEMRAARAPPRRARAALPTVYLPPAQRALRLRRRRPRHAACSTASAQRRIRQPRRLRRAAAWPPGLRSNQPPAAQPLQRDMSRPSWRDKGDAEEEKAGNGWQAGIAQLLAVIEAPPPSATSTTTCAASAAPQRQQRTRNRNGKASVRRATKACARSNSMADGIVAPRRPCTRARPSAGARRQPAAPAARREQATRASNRRSDHAAPPPPPPLSSATNKPGRPQSMRSFGSALILNHLRFHNPVPTINFSTNNIIDFDGGEKCSEQAGLLFENTFHIARNQVFDSLFAREKLGSTGLGQGVAIPHGRIRGLREAVAALVRMKEAIPFDAPDGQPVSIACILLVPEKATDQHLQILSELAQMFSDKKFRESILNSKNAEEIHKRITDWVPNVSN